MREDKKKFKTVILIMAGIFVLVGAYNAIIINSHSYLTSSQIKFAKRLDDVYGVTMVGRKIASHVSWHQLTSTRVKVAKKPAPKIIVPLAAPIIEDVPETPAFDEDLSLSLVEVINPQIWKNGLNSSDFYGSFATSDGLVQSLQVSLPNGEGLSASLAKLNGNEFKYEMNDQSYMAMLYQQDETSYMVTLTSGPLQGTSFRFSNGSQPEVMGPAPSSESTATVEDVKLGSALNPDFSL